jgi:hypothetical protein
MTGPPLPATVITGYDVMQRLVNFQLMLVLFMLPCFLRCCTIKVFAKNGIRKASKEAYSKMSSSPTLAEAFLGKAFARFRLL